jgi:hypothetical protein
MSASDEQEPPQAHARSFLDREVFQCAEGPASGDASDTCTTEGPAGSLERNEMSQKVFLEEYWQKKPFHLTQKGPSLLADVFTIEDMEELWENAMRYSQQATQLQADGGARDNPLLVFSDTGTQCHIDNPFFAFAHRCSVVVNRAERFSHSLLRLCTELEDTFPFVFVNVYVTPPGSQSVPRHSDDREVLLLQVYGQKEWTLYNSPIELPYKHEELGKARPVDDKELEVRLKCTVRQGDVLYMPRGAVHEGRTDPTCSSVHLTVALQSSDWDFNTMLVDAAKAFARRCVSHVEDGSVACGRACMPLPLLRVPSSSSPHLNTFVSASAAGLEVAREQFETLKNAFLRSAESAVEQSVRRFHDRMLAMRRDRWTECFGERCSEKGGGGGGGSLRRIALPISQSSYICWNITVDLDGISEIPPSAAEVEERSSSQQHRRLARITHVVHCSRRNPSAPPRGAESDGEGDDVRDQMSFGCSLETAKAVMMLHKRHKRSPVQVGRIGLWDDLANISLARVLVGNSSCIRVS